MECTICFVPYTDNGPNVPVLITSCGHTFCRSCLTKMRDRNHCPQCRAVFPGNPLKLPRNLAVIGLIGTVNSSVEKSPHTPNLTRNHSGKLSLKDLREYKEDIDRQLDSEIEKREKAEQQRLHEISILKEKRNDISVKVNIISSEMPLLEEEVRCLELALVNARDCLAAKQHELQEFHTELKKVDSKIISKEQKIDPSPRSRTKDSKLDVGRGHNNFVDSSNDEVDAIIRDVNAFSLRRAWSEDTFRDEGKYEGMEDVKGTLSVRSEKSRNDRVGAMTVDHALGVDHRRRIAPTGCILVSGSNDNKMKVWDVDNSTLFATINAHAGYVYTIAWSPHGKLLASGSKDKTINIWNLAGQIAYYDVLFTGVHQFTRISIY